MGSIMKGIMKDEVRSRPSTWHKVLIAIRRRNTNYLLVTVMCGMNAKKTTLKGRPKIFLLPPYSYLTPNNLFLRRELALVAAKP